MPEHVKSHTYVTRSLWEYVPVRISKILFIEMLNTIGLGSWTLVRPRTTP